MGKTMLETAIVYLATGNCSEKELRLRLERDFSATPDLEKHLSFTLKRLHQWRLINDHRIAYRIAERFSHKGNRFITHQLQQQGITDEIINATLLQIGDEYNRALIEVRAKLKHASTEDHYDETAILRFLSGRHFSLITITAILTHLQQEDWLGNQSPTPGLSQLPHHSSEISIII